MITDVFDAIDKYNMLEGTKKVVVGFSGGADSTALLHFLYFFASQKGEKFAVEALHVNHCLRGEEAIRDEEFARKFCKKIGVKIIIKRIDVRALAQNLGKGLEETGRIARYRELLALSSEDGYKAATAHTLSDSCETILFNISRGCGLTGLCGISPVRDNIIRPLINVTRTQVENYCAQNGLLYVNDSTNFEKNYTRNKIRLGVIPTLKKINPDFEGAVSRMISLLSSDFNYLEKLASSKFESSKMGCGYDVEKIKGLPQCLKSRVIVKIIKESTGATPTQKQTNLCEQLLCAGKAVSLAGGVFLRRRGNLLQAVKKNEQNKQHWQYPLQALNILTEIKTNIIIKIIPFLKYNNECNGINMKNAMDFDKLPKGCVIRNRVAGDVFTLPFRNVTKSIKKLANEFKIPLSDRENIPIIAHGNEVVWMDMVGTSKKYIPDRSTKRVAIIYKESQ